MAANVYGPQCVKRPDAQNKFQYEGDQSRWFSTRLKRDVEPKTLKPVISDWLSQ